MYASLNWIGDMLGRELDAADTAQRLTMLGATVDAVERVHEDLSEIVVGLVEHVERHPNADRLSLCHVDTGGGGGGGTLEVVCGAPNVQAGTKYPYAAVGTVLPGGLKLAKRKIRGVVSNGMLCSARELGLGQDQEGIMALSTDATPGTRLLDVLGLADTRLDIDITPNRPDLLCQKGIARELAAVLGGVVKLSPIEGEGAATAALAPRRAKVAGRVGGIEVRLDDGDGSPRYIAGVIEGVRIGPSPEWLQARLRSIGVRPINNVVDATNYILHELNQPLHAFDLRNLREGTLIVRRAAQGETLRTLDGVDRTLTPEMTMICDGKGPIAVAGIMGGTDSEVTDETTDVLLECAYFDPKRIRATRTALKMNTDASYRFERGIDLEGMTGAVRRAVELIMAVAGGVEPEPALDLQPHPVGPTTVFLRPERVAHLLGVELSRDEIERHLASVGFTVAPRDDRMAVQVPGWRPDVQREVDLIEEVARLHGYDAFPVEMRPFRPTTVPDAPSELVAARIRRLLCALSLHEARTMPLGPAPGSEPQEVLNPLSADEAHLRTALLPGLVRSVEGNWAAGVRDVRLFEIGRVFRAKAGYQPPDETIRLAGVLTGAREPGHWVGSGCGGDLDLWDVKGMLEEAMRVAVGPGAHLSPNGKGGWDVQTPGGVVVGGAGPIDADAPPWAGPVLGFELDVAARPSEGVRFVPLPATPAVERDVALVLPPGVTAAQVEDIVRRTAGPLLEACSVFDEYRGSDLAGRSVAWRLIFRHPERTLREADVAKAEKKVLAALREELGVRRRES